MIGLVAVVAITAVVASTFVAVAAILLVDSIALLAAMAGAVVSEAVSEFSAPGIVVELLSVGALATGAAATCAMCCGSEAADATASALEAAGAAAVVMLGSSADSGFSGSALPEPPPQPLNKAQAVIKLTSVVSRGAVGTGVLVVGCCWYFMVL